MVSTIATSLKEFLSRIVAPDNTVAQTPQKSQIDTEKVQQKIANKQDMLDESSAPNSAAPAAADAISQSDSMQQNVESTAAKKTNVTASAATTEPPTTPAMTSNSKPGV